MLQRVRRLALRLHKDESGPNTVEWVLLVIVGLVILVAIYLFVNWVIDRFQDAKTTVEEQDSNLNPGGGP